MDSISYDDTWATIDSLLIEGNQLGAISIFVKNKLGNLIEAIDAVDERKKYLQAKFPDKFAAIKPVRVRAFENLRSIKDEIVVIEGHWDGDSEGWFVRLTAIVRPNNSKNKYSEVSLTEIRGIDRQVERAVELGDELAIEANVPFYLTSSDVVNVDYEKRWWDQQQVQRPEMEIE